MLEPHCTKKGCGAGQRLVCECLQITEEALTKVLAGREIKTVKDIRRLTGAGDGCTVCHKLLQAYLEAPVMATV